MAVSWEREAALWGAGAATVVGIDEVGRGALAGPVSVGAVAVSAPVEWPQGLADSKRLTPARRDTMAVELADFGAGRAVAHASAGEIDDYGIVAALRLAAMRALAALAEAGVAAEAVLLDGKHDWLTAPAPALFDERPQPPLSRVAVPPVTTVIGGDDLCASIAAASVLAKVERDAMMVAAADAHPEYGWAGNKGYGAAEHLDALRRLGPSPLHRVSWALPERDAPA